MFAPVEKYLQIGYIFPFIKIKNKFGIPDMLKY